jgi:aspartyl-tRNA(Asn)/glutamyl-tRNA(Gln) amidotransferase subunit A
LFEFSSIQHYHDQLRQGSNTCLQAVVHYLQQIKNTNRLNAFIEVFTDEALTRATQLDDKRKSGKPTGKLHGVIVGIKDVICYKDHKLSASSKILQAGQDKNTGSDFISIFSATAVERLLAEDAIIIGRLNCDEFAMGSTNENSAYGKVLNALDETRIPGGSSGGSAVAVQAGLCMVSLGSDTGGSVRQPADLCGIVGLKPTYGRISRYGLIAYASSFDQIGVFGNNIPDVAIMLEVMAGPDEYDSTVSQKLVESYAANLKDDRKYRIAYFTEALDHPSLDPEIGSAIKNTIAALKEEGHDTEAVEFNLLDYIVPTYYVLSTAEASSNLSRYDGVKYGYRAASIDTGLPDFYKETRSAGFGKEVRRRIMLGTFVLSAGFYDAYFTQAQKVRKLLYEKTRLIFQDFDFILMPTTPSVAFKIGEKMDDPISMYLADIYTVMANLVGVPAISVPLYTHSKSGMPFGLQVLAKRFNELSLLRISDQLMNHSRSKDKFPATTDRL